MAIARPEPSELVKLYGSAIAERYGKPAGDSLWKTFYMALDNNGNIPESVMLRVMNKGEKELKLGEDFTLFTLGFMGGTMSDL